MHFQGSEFEISFEPERSFYQSPYTVIQLYQL